jgi:hypothetical protein
MIELTYNMTLLIYLFFTMTSVLLLWLYSHYQRKKRIIFSLEEGLFQCEYCHLSYVDKRVHMLHRCPQCGLLNKIEVYHR